MIQATLPSRRRQGKKNSFPATVNIRDLLKFYTNKYGTPTKGGCKHKIVRAVIKEFNAFLAEQLIKGDRIVLPYNLGSFEIQKQKQKYSIKEDGKLETKNLLVDWPKTWEYWKVNGKAASEKKLIYYVNDHTDNFRYKIKWDKYGVKSNYVSNYSFHPSRLLSRKFANHLFDPETIPNYAERC